MDGDASSAFRPGSGCGQTRKGKTRRLFRKVPRASPSHVTSDARRRQSASHAKAGRSGFLEAVADAVQGFDHLEIVVHDLELLAQPFDVAVDSAIVDIDLIVIGGIHQGVAAFHYAGA